MNTAKKNQTEDEALFIFKIIRGGKYHSGNTEKLINDLWLVCHSTFWADEAFSEKEVAYFKTLLSAHFKDCRNTEDRFKDLIECIVMAKQYVAHRPWRYVAKPNEWLDINYRYGLAGTRSWYKRLRLARSIDPSYKKELSMVAEALLAYSSMQDHGLVQEYMDVFCKNGHYSLLRFYINAVLVINTSSK